MGDVLPYGSIAWNKEMSRMEFISKKKITKQG
jgi:hypothetical protein